MKIVLTVLAGASTVYSGVLGKVISDHQDESADGVTEPNERFSDRLASAQRQQKVLQWVTPALTLVLIALAAQQGAQQRPIKSLLATTIKNIRG